MKAMSTRDGEIEPSGYGELLEQIKTQVREARIQAARRVNTALIVLSGRSAPQSGNDKPEKVGAPKLSPASPTTCAPKFPQKRGLSQRNLVYMRTFAGEF